jgi:AcrR family transcriptional regulator
VKQGERRAQARARLIDAATELVGKGGFVRASVEDIGSTAGMSRGAVNFHFGSKAALLEALLASKASEWAEEAPRDATAKLGASVASVVDAHWAVWTADPGNLRLLLMFVYEALGPSAQVRPEIVAMRHSVDEYIDDRLLELQRAGGLDADADRGEIARMIVNPLLGLVAQSVLDGGSELASLYESFRQTLDARWPGTRA